MADEGSPMERVKERRSAILGSRTERPAPIGVTIKAMIERQARNPSTVTYNLEMTVLEVLRGKDALDRLRIEGVNEGEHQSGLEYLMVFLRLKYYPKARGLPEYEPYVIDENQFSVVSQKGDVKYGSPHLIKLPFPQLIGMSISINESVKGWLVFQAPLEEKEPLLTFDRDYTENRLTLRTARGVLWFKLYNFDPMNIDDSCVECTRPGY